MPVALDAKLECRHIAVIQESRNVDGVIQDDIPACFITLIIWSDVITPDSSSQSYRRNMQHLSFVGIAYRQVVCEIINSSSQTQYPASFRIPTGSVCLAH